jgi:AcrR family transcriptional regulator
MYGKKTRILNAADELFAKFGFKKTTIDDIAKAARMGKSSLYYYFKSKEEIFAQIITIDSTLFKHELENTVQKGSTPQQKITDYVVTRMLHLQQLKNYYRTLHDEYLDQYAFTERARQDFYTFEVEMLSTLLNEGVREGVYAIEDIQTTARYFALCLKGLEYPFFTSDVDRDFKLESKQLLTILLKGVETR